MSSEFQKISNQRADEIIEMIADITALKFQKRLETEERESFEGVLVTALNILSEEWEDAIISREYLEFISERYRLMVENSHDAILLFNLKNGRLQASNRAAYEMLNNEALNKDADLSFNDFLHFKSLTFRDIQNRFREENDFFAKDDLILKNGEVKEVALNFKAAILGEDQYFQINMIDETEKNISIRKLEESKSRYQDLIANINDGLMVTNNKGIILEVNASLSKITGFTKEELTGKNSQRFFLNNSEYGKLESRFDQLISGKMKELELPIKHKDGRQIYVRLSIARIELSEKDIGLVTLVSDISAQKEHEMNIEQSIRMLKESEEKLRKEHEMAIHYQTLLLNSRLNPNFIYSSLNALQYFVIDEKPEKSLDYISKFADLMRKVLKNTEDTLIPLSEEISLITDYLVLEKSRFNDNFNFSINLSPEIIPGELLIPPMLIHPFIENTVIHGLSHIEKNGILNISFETVNKDKVRCVIEDNGKGLQEAQNRNVLKDGGNDLDSLNINKRRIDILNSLDTANYDLELLDLSELNEGSGMRTIITFPLVTED